MQQQVQDSKRTNQSLLAAFEAWILPQIALALPSRISPDHLTSCGLLAAVLIGCSYWLTSISYDWLWLANAGFILHWVADSLDGTLARVRNIQRERYGFFVDHFADSVAVLLIGVGASLSPLIVPSIALLLIIAYFAMMILVYLVTLTRREFKISFAGLGPTEVRLVLILANITVWATGNPDVSVFGRHAKLFSIFGALLVVILFAAFFIFGELERKRLAVVDPLPTNQEIADSHEED